MGHKAGLYPCPRGTGKVVCGEPCKGKVENAHLNTPVNDKKKVCVGGARGGGETAVREGGGVPLCLAPLQAWLGVCLGGVEGVDP